MPYSLQKEDLKKLRKAFLIPEFINAEMLIATYATDAYAVREALPGPLLPAKAPLATVFVARYPETNFGCVYNEGALLLHCRYKEENGLYCLSMQVDDDMALIGGRERFGYPKKMAESIALERTGNRVVGSVRRKGAEILRMECELEGELSQDISDETLVRTRDWNGVECYRQIIFLFKFFQNPGGRWFDYLPRLVREPVLFRNTGPLLQGRGEIKVASSAFDPLGDIPVRQAGNIVYGKWHNTMLPGKVVRRLWNPFGFVRHAFSKVDLTAEMTEAIAGNAKRAKEIWKAAGKF